MHVRMAGCGREWFPKWPDPLSKGRSGVGPFTVELGVGDDRGPLAKPHQAAVACASSLASD
jgi:hypothetical protein